VLGAAGAQLHLAHPLGVKGFAYRRVKMTFATFATPQTWRICCGWADYRQGVLLELASLLVLTQQVQVHGDAACRVERVEVVVAQDPTVAAQGVLLELARLVGRVRNCAGCARLPVELKVSGWSWPNTRRRRARVSAKSCRAACPYPACPRVMARPLAETRVSGWSYPIFGIAAGHLGQ